LLENLAIDLPRPRTMEMMSSAQFGEHTLKIRALLASAASKPDASARSTM